MLIPSWFPCRIGRSTSLSRRVNANSQLEVQIPFLLSRRVNANSQQDVQRKYFKIKLIKKGEC